ncbi:DUF2505 domain-containing protein [Herbihabitans rhizosphaerae]|nr:DUF2505 domain-containing protein [Herbihabitans rhizosphaerae]
MAGRIEHRASFATPAHDLYSKITSEAFLTDRLEALGGKNAQLSDYSATENGVSYRLRQGMDAENLPSAARTLLKGDLVVHRLEEWRAQGDGYTGSLHTKISGAPGEIKGTARVRDVADGSELAIDANVTVGIPLVGGKLEQVIASQVQRLLTREAEFTAKWLAAQSG